MDRTPVTVRRATDDDAGAMHDASVAAIRRSAADHYDERQLDVWSARRTLEGHRRMIADTAAFVAVVDGQVAGFASVALRPVGALVTGEVDQLFVHPAHGGRGIARLLLKAVETAAREAGLAELVTHASWRAAPVFERLGYRRVEIETVHLDGVAFTRVLMCRPTTRA